MITLCGEILCFHLVFPFQRLEPLKCQMVFLVRYLSVLFVIYDIFFNRPTTVFLINKQPTTASTLYEVHPNRPFKGT